MSKLRGSGYLPLNTHAMIKKRVEALKTRDLEEIKFWLDQSLHTPDGFAYPSQNLDFSGKFKFVPDSDLLFHIDSRAKIISGALELPNDEGLPNDGHYVKLEGTEFNKISFNGQIFALLADKFDPRKQNYKLAELYDLGATPLGRHLGVVKIDGKEIDEVVNSDLWLAFLRGDKQLLIDYKNNIIEELQRRGNLHPREWMGIFLGEEQKRSSMRPLAVYPLEYMLSLVDGRPNLNYGVVSLIGEHSEPHWCFSATPTQTLDKKL